MGVFFYNFIGSLAAAFSGGERLQRRDIDELREYIKEYEDSLK